MEHHFFSSFLRYLLFNRPAPFRAVEDVPCLTLARSSPFSAVRRRRFQEHLCAACRRARQPGKKRFAIALHGGAGKSPDKMTRRRPRRSRRRSARRSTSASKVLEGGGTSLDAVEQVIRFLEDDPLFNAGHGAVFNAAGGHELDASIMDGRTQGLRRRSLRFARCGIRFRWPGWSWKRRSTCC